MATMSGESARSNRCPASPMPGVPLTSTVPFGMLADTMEKASSSRMNRVCTSGPITRHPFAWTKVNRTDSGPSAVESSTRVISRFAVVAPPAVNTSVVLVAAKSVPPACAVPATATLTVASAAEEIVTGILKAVVLVSTLVVSTPLNRTVLMPSVSATSLTSSI